MSPAEETIQKRFIQQVNVEGLFGQFDHNLSFGDRPPTNPNLFILYGENGTGKTTLLWLIYHLLNKEGRRGHRSYLARQQFKKIEVAFSDGLRISADRLTGDKGSFVLRVLRGDTETDRFAYEPNKEGKIPETIGDAAEHQQFMGRLPQFNFGFLPHDRSTRIDPARRNRTVSYARVALGEPEQLSPIRLSINTAIGTARRQAIRASNEGQLSVNAIYTELIRQIALVALTPPESGVDEARFRLMGRLQEQARLTHQYSKFGLISELPVEGLLETLKAMPPSRVSIVDKVLEPFLRGNEARLGALNALYIALTTAVETINALYLNKRISLHLDAGANISTSAGPLLPEQLSSGEQELLILFCEVISALRPDTIFFIDEPELSLNVSWQRVLLNALLRCAGGSTVQFVIATHSIELLANHRANVVRLSNKVATASASLELPTEDAGG
jgi:predicted ATPase